MNFKKIFITTLIIIFVPFLIITIFIQEQKSEFKYVSNMNVRVKREDTGKIDLVPFEEYITGVLAGEMPITFNMEALKAQTVAARSYVMKKMAYNKDKDYDVVDTIMNQVYLDDEYLQSVWKDDYDTKISKIRQAVNSTRGEYLEYKGSVVEAFFFSTSVGKTENSEDVFINEVPYLRSVDSSWEEGVSPVFYDYFNFKLIDFLKKLGLPESDKITQKTLKTTSTGRIKEIMINDKIFLASEVVSKLNLRSAFFTIVQSSDNVKITTKGYGHGVGMSQYGAEAMARLGYTYDQILKHYYLDVEIKKIT
ncbi:MAG: stage II sporulation protein D [Bacilli bacterium]|nr:stage II sporulation protein D [Bacilli bacterium]MDD4718365.1 stage II sporulation protein D [Bacilli bacterium]